MGNKIYILTGPVHSGKTTAIMNWIKQRNDVQGILTPVSESNTRMFYDINTRNFFPMITDGKEKEVLIVGKYIFSKKSFTRANETIRNGSTKKGWMIIDEIGPLELKGEGFADILKEVIQVQDYFKLLLVIRENIIDEVISRFGLNDSIIIGIDNIHELK